jgi:hypothetical protein
MTNIIKNPKEKIIYNLIKEDIEKSGKGYSTLSNNKISLELKLSPFYVRDRVISLYKNGFLVCLTNYWDEDNNFYHRQLLMGDKTITE